MKYAPRKNCSLIANGSVIVHAHKRSLASCEHKAEMLWFYGLDHKLTPNKAYCLQRYYAGLIAIRLPRF